MMTQSPDSRVSQNTDVLIIPWRGSPGAVIVLVIALALVHLSLREAGRTNEFFLPAWSWDEVGHS